MAKEKEKERTVKMWFHENKFYNDLNVPLYVKDKVYDVPESMVTRWLKRGGKLLSDGAPEKGVDTGIVAPKSEVVPPAKEEAPVEEPPKEEGKSKSKDKSK